jgi:hypothetical protein
MFKDTWLINIYALSGAKSDEREAFFTNDITHLLPANSTEMLLAGDSNCVVSPKDYFKAKFEQNCIVSD